MATSDAHKGLHMKEGQALDTIPGVGLSTFQQAVTCSVPVWDRFFPGPLLSCHFYLPCVCLALSTCLLIE